MNDKIGRNELCPCGSGKKYKQCCLATTHASAVEVVDFEWHHLRKLEGEIVDQHLIPYVTKELSKEVMHAALSDLMPENLPKELDHDIYFQNFFMPLFLFNWLSSEEDFKLSNFDVEHTIAENYLKIHGNRLNSGVPGPCIPYFTMTTVNALPVRLTSQSPHSGFNIKCFAKPLKSGFPAFFINMYRPSKLM